MENTWRRQIGGHSLRTDGPASRRSGDRFLCLYRFRCGINGRRGNTRTEPGCAHRHHRIAGDLHGHLHRGRSCVHWNNSYNILCREARHRAGGTADDGLAIREYRPRLGNLFVTIVAFGSVVAHTAVLLVFQLGQPRIFFSMARDGLLPPSFAKVHPRFRTPHVTTILTGVVVGVCAMFTSIDEMVDLTNIGTLFAFILVCTGILILRKREPNRPRAFRTPWCRSFRCWVSLSCVYLMLGLPWMTWIRFGFWLVFGLFIYFYGRLESKRSASDSRHAERHGPHLRRRLGQERLGKRYAVSLEQTTMAPCGSNARPISPLPATTSSGSRIRTDPIQAARTSQRFDDEQRTIRSDRQDPAVVPNARLKMETEPSNPIW